MGKHDHIFNTPIISPFSVVNINPNANLVYTGSSATATFGYELVGHPHIVEIINYEEDVGQDGYKEDLDWKIGHHPECIKRLTMADQFGMIPIHAERIKSPHDDPRYDAYAVYECEMATEIQRHGIDRLSFPWTDLEPGEYKIQLEAQYNSGSYGQPYDPPARIVLL